MSDYDVKVGVTTVGDTSGADKVDQSIKQVGVDAEQVSQATGDAASKAAEAAAKSAEAAAKAAQDVATNLEKLGQKNTGVKTTTDDVQELAGAFDKLGNEKLKRGAEGLTDALNGMISGDKEKGLQGLATSFFALANAIPLPGAAIVASIAITAGVKLWKSLSDDADEAKRSVNDLGLTVDEEMARLESWSQSQFEWDGIKNADANLRADFALVKDSAGSAMKAVMDLFNVRSDAKVSALQRQISDAEASGDTSRAQDLKAQVETEKAIAELVKLNVEMTQAKAELAAQTALAKQAEAAYNALVAKADEQKQKLDELNQTIVALTGNKDATVPGSDEQKALIDQTRGKANYLAEEAARLSQIKGYEDLAAARRQEAEGINNLLTQLLDMKDQNDRVADAEKAVENARAKSNETASKAATEMTTLGLQIEALKIKLQDAATAAGPEVAQKAAEQAGLMTGAVGDMIEKQLKLTADNSKAIIETANAGKEGALSATGDLDAAKQKYKASLADKQVPAAVEELGADVAGSSEASAEVIGEGKKKIQKAIEETAAVAATAGDTFKPMADEFNEKVNAAATLFRSGAQDLAAAARHSSSIARQIAEEQATLAQQLAGVRQLAGSALDTANLAISQIKNTR